MIRFGRETESLAEVAFNDRRARAVFICGKRGSGKSYTMGVLLEELIQRDDVLVIVLDPMSIFHTMSIPNRTQQNALYDWGYVAKEMPVRLLVPGDAYRRYGNELVENYRARGVDVASFRLNAGDLSADAWLELFNLDITTPMGLALHRAVGKLERKQDQYFTVGDIIKEVQRDPHAKEGSIQALVARLGTVDEEWDLFSDTYMDPLELFRLRTVNIVDIGVLDSGRYSLRNLAASVLIRDLFHKRRIDRQREELGLSTKIPKVWLAIDEAQEFAPQGRSALGKELLIQWVKEGRQPGL